LAEKASGGKEGITEEERRVLFEYFLIPGEQVYERTGEDIIKYTRNILLILNCFFSYGFISRSKQTPRDDGIPHFQDHYWSFIVEHLSAQQSVQYLEYQRLSAPGYPGPDPRAIALEWLTIALQEDHLLVFVVQEAFTFD
jgi:hypothetical protein